MSNQAKWTPGNWKKSRRNNNDAMLSFHGVLIGEVFVDIPTPNEIADAHLIAAAPDLYEALIKLHSSIGVDDYGNRYADINDSMANEIENALAKARGES